MNPTPDQATGMNELRQIIEAAKVFTATDGRQGMSIAEAEAANQQPIPLSKERKTNCDQT